MTEPQGFALLDKAAGLSSFSALNPVKRRVAPSKLGHSGTLDPFATGLLVGLAGPYSHLSPVFSGLSKSYTAELCIGAETDTLDPEGAVIAEAPVPGRAAFESVLPGFRGEIQQRPPAYSALHVNGKRAYELARAGQPPELPARPVHIYELSLLDYAESSACNGEGQRGRARLFVRCSSGTYIRSLARDIGLACGTRAFLSALRRDSIGPFNLEQAVAPEDFDCGRDLMPMTPDIAAALGLDALILPAALEKAFNNGGSINPAAFRTLPGFARGQADARCAAVFDAGSVFRGLVEISDGKLKYHFVIRREL